MISIMADGAGRAATLTDRQHPCWQSSLPLFPSAPQCDAGKGAGVPTLKFLYVDLTGFAGTSHFNLPLPVYLAGKKDWEAKRHSLGLPIFASCGTSPQGSQ